ncbi:glycerophosphodiester phosphodiesterase family protein [Roseivirga sp. BDSF3-8]|uniref:glycerophosphodiester phosphodiesterase family protein n=1 Tax=Roseivirga sp. BDSF3-8 TaxID=3241598 RepID=UPI0035326037
MYIICIRKAHNLLAVILMAAMIATSCQSSGEKFDLQGHRGARGLMPENTIPAFKKALEFGVSTLELDVVISADSQVVVSHEPWINPEICSFSDTVELNSSSARNYNLYRMSYDSIARFDCGSSGNPRFPGQQKMNVSKPLLSEVFKVIEEYISANDLGEVSYNIEIKSSVRGDDLYHPAPGPFSDLVYQTIARSGINNQRMVIQSFDFRALRYWHQTYPGIKLAALVEGEAGSAPGPDALIKELGFTPAIYSPHYSLLSPESIRAYQQEGMKVIPWTVNESADMKNLMQQGVDGLITDYPDRFPPPSPAS